MTCSPLSIRAFRPASSDIVFPYGDDLISPFVSKRFLLDDGAAHAAKLDARAFLCFAPNLGLDLEFINEAAALYSVDYCDLRSLCKPGGLWLRELYFEPHQFVCPSR